MSKAITKSETWRHRSASYATHGSRKGINLLGWDVASLPEELTDQQRIDAIQQHKKWLECELVRAKASGASKERIKDLGIAINHANMEVNKIRPGFDGRDLNHWIIDVLKPRFTKSEWDRIVREALALRSRQEK